MDREHHSNELPSKLRQYLQSCPEEQVFRRRAVLISSNDSWTLLCCTIEGFRSIEQVPEPVTPRRYSKAILHEDWLTGKQCLNIATDLHAGRASFDDITLEGESATHWSTEFVPIRNDFMPYAGRVISTSWGQQGTPAPLRTLVAPNLPYYPDTDEAARDWLPFSTYHGHSDSRNRHIIFLLPEDRAFISNSEYSEAGTLQITISGNQVASLPLLIKGAYWEEKAISQVESVVSGTKAVLAVPANADRLEFCLIDGIGTIYDFHREDQYSRLRNEGSVLNSSKRSLIEQVRRAVHDGEGLHVEFKPFVDPRQPLTSNGQRTKLHEVLATVVAFANTSGGSVYLGIDDDCALSGIAPRLGEWAKGAVNDENLERYVGALKASIKDHVQGEVTVQVLHVHIDGSQIVVIEVAPAATKPVIIRQDNYLYARKGASNRKVPPDEWRTILDSNAEAPFFGRAM